MKQSNEMSDPELKHNGERLTPLRINTEGDKEWIVARFFKATTMEDLISAFPS